jgi:hypothetical protein
MKGRWYQRSADIAGIQPPKKNKLQETSTPQKIHPLFFAQNRSRPLEGMTPGGLILPENSADTSEQEDR